jgi:tetratricopeptide (TPR) repeat protein
MSRCARAGAAAALVVALACAHAPPPDPRYQPSASVLEVVATLRRHVPDDTYRFPPATDFTGRNVYRSSLVRLENLQSVYADALRAGQLDDVIAFAKGRALERLRAYELAADSYRRAAERPGELQKEALHGADVCDRLAEAVAIGFEPDRPVLPGETPVPAPANPDQEIADYDRRLGLLEALEKDTAGTHYVYVVREEIERTDEARADYFEARRRLVPDGNVRAIAELQRVVSRHRESKRANRHLLELAGLYATLAREYIEARPPESLWFDPPTFQELVDNASRLYEAVANQDGTPEKLEAARKLEAFLAFTLQVDRDRFSP